MRARRKLLFIQVPYADNQVGGCIENLRLAAIYLRHAMQRCGEDAYFKPAILPALTDVLDDAHLVEYIVRRRPAVIVATLYLWNVERTLDIVRAVRKRLPGVVFLAGGPEVAPDHPFLFRDGVPDAVAVGEGEQVFPAMLAALRKGTATDLAAVAWRRGRKYEWGRGRVERRELRDLLPGPLFRFNRPDANGAAYMESSRGCPLKCAFCCYNQKRHGVSHLPAREVLARVAVLAARGAREIRFVDPTFNSNPDFEVILRGLAAMNRRHRLAFFAELRAETVTREQAALLKRANFTDIEVGVQSRDPEVLRVIRRPGRIAALDRGVNLLARQGIRLTIDIMCGLPRQSLRDIRKSLKWAFSVRNGYVQFLHTLLIPGTELRARRREYRLHAQERPPYRVLSTPTLSAAGMQVAEKTAWDQAGRLMDSPAVRFAGKHLPDLFEEKVTIDVDSGLPVRLPGRMNRRAVLIRGVALYERKDRICRLIRQAVAAEPHMLWQFVLCPVRAEPLDLLDSMIEVLDSCPPHLLDNMAVMPDVSRLVARRIFVQLAGPVRYGRGWLNIVEEILSDRFY